MTITLFSSPRSRRWPTGTSSAARSSASPPSTGTPGWLLDGAPEPGRRGQHQGQRELSDSLAGRPPSLLYERRRHLPGRLEGYRNRESGRAMIYGSPIVPSHRREVGSTRARRRLKQATRALLSERLLGLRLRVRRVGPISPNLSHYTRQSASCRFPGYSRPPGEIPYEINAYVSASREMRIF